MDLQTYVSFLEKLGGKIVWSNDIPFYSFRRGFLWAVPRYTSYDVEPEKLRHLVWKNALGVFYTTSKYGARSITHWVCEGPELAMSTIQKRKRTAIRRGLEACKIERFEWDLLKTEGLQMNRDILKRQNRVSGMIDDPKWWGNQCDVSSQFEDIKVWGAFIKGQPANYDYVTIHDDVIIDGMPKRVGNIVHGASYSKYIGNHPEFGKNYPNEALDFVVINELLQKENCDLVIIGQKSNTDSLEMWKRHMGFQKKILQENVIANIFLNAVTPFVPKLKNFIKTGVKS